MDKKKRKIDLDLIFKISKTSINRAFAFSGLAKKVEGINVDDISLGGPFELKIISQEDWAKNQEHYKSYFLRWVSGKSIEDLIESFELMLNQIYDLLVLTGIITAIGHYDRLSLREKISLLIKCGIIIPYDDSIISMSLVRHCLTHSLEGTVRKLDIKRFGGKFNPSWYTACPCVEGEQEGIKRRVKVEFPFDTSEFDGETTLGLIFEKKEKLFQVGQPVIFSPVEMQEICFTFYLSLCSIKQSLLETLEKNGFSIKKTG